MKNRSEHRLYSTWKSMRSRCNNPNIWSYHRYGGKGIKICARWDDFWLFIEDMGGTFKEGLTLDRIECNGNYCPENCRWSDKLAQMNNREACLSLFFEGEYYTESELARKTGIIRTTIQRRRRAGYSVHEMVYGREVCVNGKPILLEFKGEIYNIAELSRLTGVNVGTLQWRRKQGYSVLEMVYSKNKL